MLTDIGYVVTEYLEPVDPYIIYIMIPWTFSHVCPTEVVKALEIDLEDVTVVILTNDHTHALMAWMKAESYQPGPRTHFVSSPEISATLGESGRDVRRRTIITYHGDTIYECLYSPIIGRNFSEVSRIIKAHKSGVPCTADFE
jgi:alkyl hydroperoxide reductase subunit AhpC